jgi:glycosyltransferase involved in cell wall biosynthesis
VRVLLTADAVGGVFTYALELAGALAGAGAEVILATEGARLGPDQRAAVRAIPRLVLHESAFRLEWMTEPWDDVAASGRWLLALEARERPDVVHLDAYAHGRLPFRAPKLVVGHSCVLSWWEAVKGEPAPREAWTRYRAVVRAGLAGADAVVAPSAAFLRALERLYGPLPPARVVPNGRGPERFRPGPKEPLVLAAGRVWDEAKNVAAVARVAERLPWPVYVAGEAVEPGREGGDSGEGSGSRSGSGSGPHRGSGVEGRDPLSPRAPEQLDGTGAGGPFDSAAPFDEAQDTLRQAQGRYAQGARRSGRGEGGARRNGPVPGGRSATFLGRLSHAEMSRWLGRAAIFIHPARYEPFGLAVLEAALSGCALVLGDLESLRENWDGAAVFSPPTDDAALVARVAELAANPGLRAALGARARARALDLGADRMAAAYLDVYRALLVGAPLPRGRGGAARGAP